MISLFESLHMHTTEMYCYLFCSEIISIVKMRYTRPAILYSVNHNSSHIKKKEIVKMNVL